MKKRVIGRALLEIGGFSIGADFRGLHGMKNPKIMWCEGLPLEMTGLVSGKSE
jgi:hypothetical protein